MNESGRQTLENIEETWRFFLALADKTPELKKNMFIAFEESIVKEISKMPDGLEKDELYNQVRNIQTPGDCWALCKRLNINNKHTLIEIVNYANRVQLLQRRN